MVCYNSLWKRLAIDTVYIFFSIDSWAGMEVWEEISTVLGVGSGWKDYQVKSKSFGIGFFSFFVILFIGLLEMF